MPCGGIYPAPAFGGPDALAESGPCWECRKYGCELWVEEWDTPLHEKCLDAFMLTGEGAILLEHGHTVMTTQGKWDPTTAWVSGMEAQQTLRSSLYEIERKMTPSQLAAAKALLKKRREPPPYGTF